MPDGARIERVERDGRVCWLKRRERRSLRWRLQKGGAGTFEAERAALEALGAAGLAVPEVIEAGADYLLLSDCGETLARMLRRARPPDLRRAAFAAAGQGLAAFHAAGYAHGRPSLRDICYRDGTARFIDFERYSPRRNTPRGFRNDLVLFVFSLHADAGPGAPEIAAATDAYRAAAPPQVWSSASRLARRLRWLAPLAAPLAWREARRKPRRVSREFAALAPTLRYLAER